MESNEEQPSSAATQPLLSKQYPSPIDEPSSLHSDPTNSEPEASQYLQISYNYGPRPIKDLPFLILFSLFVLCSFGFGIFASVHRNPKFSNVSSYVYDSNSTSCVKESSSSAFDKPLYLYSWDSAVLTSLIWTLVITLILTVKIIGVASHALCRNLALFGVLLALTLGLVVYYVPIVVFLVFVKQNGKIVTRYEGGEYYCAWKQDSWVPAYFALAILTMLWSASAMVEAQVYVISGTVAQWYFSKDDSGPRPSIRNSLRNALGPSFGTVCLSGLLICVVRLVRAMVDSASQEDATGVVNLILRCCVNALVVAFDFLNKFTINFAAITGEAYCSSERMTYELLKRNLLSAVFVETVSTRLLGGIIFVLSAIYAIVVCAILNGVSNLGVDSYFVAAMAWVLLLVVLGYFVHVLDNVIDTVYVCYAIDRDRGEVYKQEVHEVYIHLPISRNHKQSLIPQTPFSNV
ncbi:plasma-membrane choline transporter family protein [Actinidia rufa]|uniref:Choline transporter-like protein n=1 Tax=Actinidia rufa TaxID=165716 RepID=A0A7J0F7A5_9ERIC|nr:plasma-membrane choline transporter family protein [Actinidia rufa]